MDWSFWQWSRQSRRGVSGRPDRVTFFLFSDISSAASLGKPLRLAEERRARREVDASQTQHIDLNITVPYIFSARLYPHGTSKGDKLLSGQQEAISLQQPLRYFSRVFDTLYVCSYETV